MNNMTASDVMTKDALNRCKARMEYGLDHSNGKDLKIVCEALEAALSQPEGEAVYLIRNNGGPVVWADVDKKQYDAHMFGKRILYTRPATGLALTDGDGWSLFLDLEKVLHQCDDVSEMDGVLSQWLAEREKGNG